MKNKIKLMIIFCILVIMSNFIIVNAQSTTITATGENVNSQEEITITLTSSVSLWGYTVSVTDAGGCTFKSVSVPSNVSGNPNGSTIGGASDAGTTTLATYKFTAPSVTADKNCTIKFSISGILSAADEELDDTSATATIKVSPVVTPPTENNGGSTTTTPEPETPVVTKSDEARLKNFGIEPYDFSGFKRDKYEYSTEVANNVTEVEIYAQKLDDKATVEGAGKVSLKEGNNTFEVKVTAADGTTTKTYKLTIKRRTEEEENVIQSEARLSNLGIRPDEYDFEGFDKDKTEYTVEIPNEVKEIEIYAEAIDADAQITGIGEFTLEEGDNTLIVEVISPNGTKKTYTIKVTRPEEEVVDEKSGLSKLSIAGLTFSPKFDSEQYEYSLDLTEDLSSLEIDAKAVDENWTIEIVGNENLQQGENTITILVTNKETEEVATYQIIVNKNVVAEEIVTSWLKPSTWGKEEKIKILLILVIIVLIIAAIILKIKMSKEEKLNHNIDFPGADELDKAIAEHQELSEEEKIQENEIDREEVKANYLEEIAKNRSAETESSIIFEEEIIAKPKRKGRHF